MKNVKLFLYLLLLSVTFISCSNHNKKDIGFQQLKFVENPSKEGFCTDRLSRIDSLVERFLSEGKAVNCVAMVGRNGKIIYNKAFGWKNVEKKEKVTESDIFRIASMTKGVVSVALMTLYEEGKFLLDDPLWWYIPEFREMEVIEEFRAPGDFTTRPAKRGITIRHLLSHSSGIPYDKPYNKDAGIPFTSSMHDMTTEEFVKKIATLPLDHDPGERYTYGLSTDVIGYLIEVLSGKSLDVFLRNKIFEPLGMEDTYFYLPEDKKDRLVTLYSARQDGIERSNNEVQQNFPVAGPQKIFLGGAGLCSTVMDYAKFCQMLLNKGIFNDVRILSPKTVELMTTVNQLAFNDRKSDSFQFGLGFEINGECKASGTIESLNNYGWGGMYGTNYCIDPSENMFILFMSNELPWPDGSRMQTLYRMMVYQALVN